MKRLFYLLLTVLMMMSCTDKPITMNLYYTGENGNARKFVEEMESSGTADAIRAEKGNLRYDYFFRRITRKPCCSLTAGPARKPWTPTMPLP